MDNLRKVLADFKAQQPPDLEAQAQSAASAELWERHRRLGKIWDTLRKVESELHQAAHWSKLDRLEKSCVLRLLPNTKNHGAAATIPELWPYLCIALDRQQANVTLRTLPGGGIHEIGVYTYDQLGESLTLGIATKFVQETLAQAHSPA